MPEPNIQYSVEFPDGKRANISKEVYESTKDNLYSKYPEAKVVRTSVYQPDDDDIADSDQYAISFGGNRAVISNQAFQETKDSLLAQYPDAQITKMRDESAAYWEPRRQAAMAKLDELDKQNGDFMRQYNANKTVADLLENDGVVASGQHDFVAANKAQYDTLDRQRRELLEQYYSNPNTIREYREGASRAGNLYDTYMEKAYAAETGEERRDWKRAAKLQDDIRKVYEAPNKYTDGDASNGFFQYLSDYAKGAGDVFSDKDFYTRGFTEIARNFDLRGIAKKIEEASNAKGGDLSESDIDRIISPSEKAELMSFYALSEAQRERADSISSAYRAGSSFADSVGYMAEFLLSSGLGNLAGKAMSGSSRALTSWLGKQLMSDHALRRAIAKGVTTAPQYGSKAAKVLTEAAVKPLVQGIWHTGTQISSLANISEGLLETNSNGELVSVGHAILKRGVDSVIENWSESVGGALEAGLAAPFKAAGWLGEKTLGGTSFARAARWLYESGPAQVLFEAGFNGMLGEIAEEWVGNATRVAFGLMSKDEFKDFASFRQQAEMAASFAPMSLIGIGSSTMAAYRKSNQFKAVSGKVKGILQKQGVPDGEIEDLFNTKFDTAEDIGRKVAPYLYNAHQANNADDYKTILQFIELAGREAVFEEFDKVEKEQERNSMQEQIAAGAGQFWFSGEDGTDQVRVVETNGKTYYILGQGTEGTYAAISSDGERKVFTDDRLAAGVQDGTITDTNMALEDYLQQRVDATKKTAEAERMNREANEQLAAVKAQIAAKPEVNLGTREAPVLAAVIASDNTGVMVAWDDEEGNYREQPLTWNEVANKLQTPIDVRTDEQLENDAAAALDDARARVSQYQKITPGTEIRVDLPELGEATYRFQKAIVDEGQVIIYAEDENGESKQFTEEMVVDLPGLLAQEDAATAVNVPEEGTNVVFTDENGDPVKGVVSVKDNGSGFTSVVTPAGDTVVIETARVEQDAAPAQEPEDDGVLRDFRGNPIPMIESGEDAGEVDLDAFFDRDTEAWARWNDEQRGDGGADSRQNIEVALKAVQKTIKTAQKEHDATASPNKRRKQEQAIATLVQRAEQLQGLIDGYVAREEAAKAEEEARRKIDEQRAAAQEREIGEPQDIIQLAVKTFETLNGLGKLRGGLNKDSFRRETGLGTAELARFFSWWAKKETGMTVNDVVDAMIELDGQYGFVPDAADGSEQKDSNAARNAVIELFSMYSSPSDLLGSIRRENTAQAEKEAASEEDAARAAFVQEYGMTPEEYEEVERQREQEVIEFGEAMEQEQEEIDNLASEYYDYYGQSAEAAAEADNLGAGVQGALGEDSRIGAVLPGERTDQTGGIPAAAEGESEQVGGEAVNTGGTVQEGAPAGVIEDLPEFNDNPEVAAAEAQVDLNPTDAQKEAGNYQKGHVVIDGHDITIENPKGSVRSGVDADGNPWSVTMNNTYGYIRRTEGVDGDQIDVFLSDNPTEGNVYVVDQVKPDGSFDEHKVMYGFASADEAQAAYLANYTPGWKGLGVITEVSKEEFAKWLDSSTRKTKPFSEYKSVEASGAQNQAQQEIAPAPAEAEAEQQEIAPAEEAVSAPAPSEETAPAQPEAAPAAEAESVELTDAQKQAMEFAGVDQQDIALAEVERQAPLQERIAKWRGVIGDVFTVLTGEDDVMAIQNKATRDSFLAAKEKGETVHGFYDTDTKKAYLYLPDIRNTRELDRKVLHEVISHKGLAGVMGEEGFNAFLDRVWNDMMDADSRKEFLEYVNGSSINVDDRRRAADEYVAHVAEHNTSIIKQLDETAWDKFVNAVKEILNDMIGDDFFDTGVWTVFDKELAQAFNQYRTENAEAISRADAERVRANDERRQDAIAAAQGDETKATATRKAENNPQVPISQTQEKYEDWGEKIGMARKDRATKGQKKGDADGRPAWMKKYNTSNIQMLSEDEQRLGRVLGMKKKFQEVIHDISKGTDYTQPFVGFYDEEIKSRFMYRSVRHYITDENRQPIIFTSMEQYEATVPVFEARDQGYRVRQEGDKFKIVRPASNNKLVEYAEFATREEAVAYLASPEGCTDILNRKRENYELPALERLTRNGMPDYRMGRNVTPEDFQREFGFRGGEFGNYVNADERQQALNYAYDALMDLANLLGITPQALTLGGELSIAFGARGTGMISTHAHYEATRAVINLTKMNGAGSMAHEWAHALDNYFGLMDAKRTRIRDEKQNSNNDAFLSEGTSYRGGARKEIVDAFKEVMNVLTKKTVTRQIALDAATAELQKSEKWLDRAIASQRESVVRGRQTYKYNRKTKEYDTVKYNLTDEQIAEFDRLAASLVSDPTFKRDWDYTKVQWRGMGETADKMRELVKDIMPDKKDSNPLDEIFTAANEVKKRMEKVEDAKAGKTETVVVETDMLKDSGWFDRSRASSYFTKRLEMFARAMETYLANKMKEAGQSSDYLTYMKGPLYKAMWDHNPYPEGEELKAVSAAFDKLFRTIQEKTDEQTGKQVLFSRAYHGTGADFELFDLSHAGEGEGAAAHGYGVYVTFNMKTAKGYAEKLSGMSRKERQSRNEELERLRNEMRRVREQEKDREEMLREEAEDVENPDEKARLLKEADSLANEGGSHYKSIQRVYRHKQLLLAAKDSYITYRDVTVDTPINKLANIADATRMIFFAGSYEGAIEEYKRHEDGEPGVGLYDAYHFLKSTSPEDWVAHRNLYKVEIPDDNGDNYLNEDATPNFNQLSRVFMGLIERRDDSYRKFVMIPQSISTESGRGLYKTISDVLGGKKAASDFLQSVGFDGIKYEGEVDGPCAVIFDDDVVSIMEHIRFSKRTKPAPEKTGIGYKVFFRGKDGKLYPPMVANPDGADTPVGVWLDADAAPVAGQSKTGRPQVKAGGKGTQGGSGLLAYRPGWHLGEIPYAIQFNRLNPETGQKDLFPADFVWAEVEYAADKDYQGEADAEGTNKSGKYQHSLAGLKKVPEDGFYRYRTNPNPETDPWIITGAMKVNRVLTDEEVDDIVRKAGREPQKREPEVRLSRDQKEKDETLIRVNKRLEEVSRPVSGQSLNRDSNTSRSENPAESSRLGAESDTNVDNHNQKTNKLLEELANFIGIISNDGISAKEFNKKLIGAIGIKDRGQLADYFTFDTPSGKVSLRLSSHYSHARTYRGKSNKAEKNVSLVITIPGVDKGKFKADRRVELVEFVYDSPNLERLVNIAKGIFNLVDTGKYVDLAEADSYNVSPGSKLLFSKANDGQLMFSHVTPEQDKEYMDAVKSGDMAKAQDMVNKAAEAAGYDANTDYQGSRAFNGAAPVRNGYFNTREERKAAFEDGSFEDTYSLGDYMDAGIDNNDLEWQLANPIPASARDKATLESINNLNDVVKDKKQTIKMYRAVPADVNEDRFRNGDWITPSRMYAEHHIELQDWEGGRIIEQEVSVDNIWWNGDDINEWGYDDGNGYAYKNTPNNRKLLAPVTYDDAGNVIPLSERFNENNPDIRFSRVYHGTDADFERFEDRFNGTGEGYNAHGHGHYVTEDEQTGRKYAYQMAGTDEENERAISAVESQIFSDRLRLKNAKTERDREYFEGQIRRSEKRIEELKNGQRHLYTVEIPDDDGSNYLYEMRTIKKGNRRRIADAVRSLEGAPRESVKFVEYSDGWNSLANMIEREPWAYLEIRDRLVQALGGTNKAEKQVSQLMHKAGFVGVKYDGGVDGPSAVIFSENDLKITEHVRFSKANESQRIFISNAAAAAEAVPMDKATPEQWQKMLSDRGGMKAGEDKWLGLSDWLKNQDRKTITKQEVLDFINQNQIQIEEEHYDENPKGFDDLAREYDNWLREEGYDYAWEQLTERFGDDAQIAFTDNGGELEISNGEAAATLLDSNKPINQVRLDYTTPELLNKREIALTVPTIEPWRKEDEIHFGDAGEGRAVAWVRFGDAKIHREYEEFDRAKKAKKDYIAELEKKYSPYAYMEGGEMEREKMTAEEKEHLAALRKEVAEQGAKLKFIDKVLFIDEIQSKRHQEAREQGGYKNPELQAKAERHGELSQKFYSEEGVSLEEKKEYDALQQELYEIGWKEVVDNAGRTSAAPFEKNWHELAMKRMLRLAAEEGYDYVAWTTGEQQAKRYNIGRYLQSVDKTDEGKFTLFLSGGNTTDIEVDENGIITDTDAFSEEWEGKKLSDVVGKEIAVRMMSMEVDSDDLDKIDATIGAEGMKGFYDGILVNFMNKYGKKWGIQVEDINLPDLEESARTAHAVRVTPEMKESVLQGQLMFSKEGGEKRARTPLETAYDVDRGGIKAVVGEENVSDFYNGLYRAMPEQLRAGIVSRAEDAGWNFHEALKGRLAELALAGNDDSGLLRLSERMLSDYYGHPLDEATARYILWRTAQPNDSLTDIQKTALKRRWKVGEKDTDVRFSKGDLGRRLEETSQVVGVIADGAKESLDQQKKALKGELRTVARAMSAQKVYDRSTVDTITGLAKQVLKDQEIETMSRREIARLMGLIRTSVGKAPRTVKHNADILLDIIIDNLLRTEENRLSAIVRTGASRTNASGVEVQGKLDVRGQNVLKAYRAGLDMPVGKPDDDETEGTVYARLAVLQERLDSEDDAVRAEAEAEYDGLTMALEYHENIKASSNEERSLRDDMAEAAEEARRGGMSRTAYNEYVEDTQSALRENRVDRIESFRELRIKLAELIEGSKTNAAAFRQRERDRINAIHHLANSDMQGRTADEFKIPGRLGNFLNSSLVRFFTSPLATFDQMLRAFGSKSVNGQGYLWNKYMREWIEARENEIKGTMEAKQALDRKASEVFGKEMRWSDIYDIVRDMPKAKVKWWSGGAMQDHELTQGQLLYIYMVNKMADGRMKLRRMGISEEDVQAIRNQMDERFITLADWLQDEFLVGLRNKYNAVHERLFGASMAAIEDYFPLVINKRSLNKQEDIAAEDNGDTLPATTTGSIIKRRRNSRNLDLLNADAFDVVIRHIEQMERWAAFAEYNRDLNTLLSYNRFRNQVKNMETIYGTGDVLWKNFRNVSRIAGNTYHPTVKSESLDSAAVNLAKGVTAAKINFRIYTAMKQFLSMPAFLADANIGKLAGAIAHQQQSWKWAMENLPLFESRWKSRIAGDTRLMNTDSDWKLFRSRAYDKLSKMGMSPNAFVDALTVSIGAKALYDTKYERYIEDGYTEEQAAKKAKQDATILYNETQQSSEGAFVSTVQLDRTLLSTMISVFRNSSMGFQRQLHDALRNLARRTRSGYREESLEFMTKQGVRDGLTEEQAAAAAEREYNRGMWHDMARVATFGMVVQFAWNLGASLAYLLFGDDDDKKEEMVREAFIHSLFGSIEGLSGGNIMSEALNMVAKGESLRNYDPSLLPLISDMKRIYSTWSYDKVAAFNSLANLAAQAGFGANPETITDAVVAVVDASKGDLGVANEAMLLILRVLQVPQSQLDEIYIDELGMNARSARRLNYRQMADRYAKYKIAREAGAFVGLYSDEKRKAREESRKKTFQKKVNERKKIKK